MDLEPHFSHQKSQEILVLISCEKGRVRYTRLGIHCFLFLSAVLLCLYVCIPTGTYWNIKYQDICKKL